MTTYEYVWIDGMGGLRSKSRVLSRDYTYVDELPLWNYDGSSTGQAEGTDSEINFKHYKNLVPYISKSFVIQYDSKAGKTIQHDSYFFNEKGEKIIEVQ